MKTRCTIALLSIGLLGLLPAGVRAQSESTEAEPELDAPPRFSETVEVEVDGPIAPTLNLSSARMPVPLLRTPASVSVVSEGLFEQQQGVVMGDALQNASGVNVASGFGVFDFFVIRGFDSLSSGLVLTDAAPEPEATFYPLYNVNRVEVLKGPSAFLYGANTVSGAVHLLRKRPVAERSFGDASLSLGSFGTLDGRIDANASSSDGELAGRVAALFRDSDGYRDGKENRLYAVNPAVAWRPDPETRVDLSAELVGSDFAPDTGIPVLGDAVAPVPRERSYQSPFDSSEQDVLRLRFDVERRVDDALTLRNKLYYTDLEWRSNGTLILGVLPTAAGSLGVSRTMLLLDDRQKLLGNQLEALLSFRTGAARHELLVGVELLRFTDVFTQDVGFLPDLDLLAPVETAQGVFPIPGFTTSGDSRTRVVSPYLVDRLQLGDTVEVFAGVRLDALDVEDELTGTARDETQLNPMGGLVIAPTASLSLYLSAATAFAPPSTQVVGERRPEESRQLEGGLKLRFLGDRGLASVAVYHLEKDNIAIPDQGVLRQLGDQRSRGVELELAAETADGWNASFAYAFNDAELTRFADTVQVALDPPTFLELDYSGNTPAFAPRHLFSSWVTRRLAAGLSVGAGARHVSEQFIGEDNRLAIDGYWIADAMLAYEKGPIRASVNFSNLTDAEYETRGFPGSAVIPGEPFAVYARVRVAFGSY
jgi:iron complex outermembrane receptor protein